jgi:hypothetical protein
MSVSRATAGQRTEPAEPFYGYRYHLIPRGDGTEELKAVPLTEYDLLHPQEGDAVAQGDFHIEDVLYLREVFKARAASKPGIRVLTDHLINFQHAGLQPLAPDIALLNGEAQEWDGGLSTFPLLDMKARVLFLLEVTSRSTRKKDLGDKLALYYRAGVPLYIIADPPYAGARRPLGVLAYQAGPEFYEPFETETNGRLWLDVVDVWFGIEDGRVACFDADGQKIGGYQHVSAELRKEKARAEAAEARLRELEAQLKKPKRRKKS